MQAVDELASNCRVKTLTVKLSIALQPGVSPGAIHP
jgi:hypothetical protein